MYPVQGMGNFEVQRNVQYVCLELLLSFVNDMAARANDVGLEHHPPNIHFSSWVALALGPIFSEMALGKNLFCCLEVII